MNEADQTAGELVRRLTRVEAEARVLKVFVGCAVVLFILLLVLGQTSAPTSAGVSDRICAREFALVDQEGMERGSFELKEDGSLRLGLWDSNGQNRAALSVRSDGTPSFTLSGKDGKAFTVLMVSRFDTPMFEMHGADGNSRMTMLMFPNNGSEALLFFDQTGKKRASIGVAPTGQARISLYDEKEEEVWGVPELRTPIKTAVPRTGKKPVDP